MNVKKILLMGMLTVLIGVQCWGAGNTQEELNEALLIAAQKGRSAIVQALLDKKADVGAMSEVKNYAFCVTGGETALHLAAGHGHLKTVSTLLRAKASIDKSSVSDGRTALHRAAFGGGSKTVQLLLDNDAFIEATNEHGETVLHLAVRGFCPDAVLTLLAARACIDKADNWGNTALHKAAQIGRGDVVQLLIHNGASIDAINWEGRTALCASVLTLECVVPIFIGAQYSALAKRCSAIIDMGDGNLVSQAQIALPYDVLELIIKDFLPHKLANFRSTCKYFRLIASTLFENVRKLRAVELKNKLIRYIDSALCKVERSGYWEERYKRQAHIKLLEAELERAIKLSVDGLLQGLIICDGISHLPRQ